MTQHRESRLTSFSSLFSLPPDRSPTATRQPASADCRVSQERRAVSKTRQCSAQGQDHYERNMRRRRRGVLSNGRHLLAKVRGTSRRFNWQLIKILLPSHSICRQQSNCELCDSSDPELSHPITNAVDGTHAWWQSPTLASGRQFEYVTIDIDLEQVSINFNVVVVTNSSSPAYQIVNNINLAVLSDNRNIGISLKRHNMTNYHENISPAWAYM